MNIGKEKMEYNVKELYNRGYSMLPLEYVELVMRGRANNYAVMYCPWGDNNPEFKEITKDHYLDWKVNFYKIENELEQLMNPRELNEWLIKGFGQVIEDELEDCPDTYYVYFLEDEKKPVNKDVRIRRWGSEEWIKPTKEIYYEDVTCQIKNLYNSLHDYRSSQTAFSTTDTSRMPNSSYSYIKTPVDTYSALESWRRETEKHIKDWRTPRRN